MTKLLMICKTWSARKTNPFFIAEQSSSLFRVHIQDTLIYTTLLTYTAFFINTFFYNVGFSFIVQRLQLPLYKKSMDGCWTSAQKPKEKVKHQLDRHSKTHWEMFINFSLLDLSGVVPGGAGDAMATPDLGRSVNPISIRVGG